jgi:hypothetical protein
VPSDWFEVVSGSELRQGDLLLQCPVGIPIITFPLQEDEVVDVKFEIVDLIVMTQSCDLVLSQKINFETAVLCKVPLIGLVKSVDGHQLANRSRRENLGKNSLGAWHALDRSTCAALQRGQSVVSFHEVVTLPIEYVRKFAEISGDRLRLKSPYLEHMSQRFAHFFGRVALEAQVRIEE